MSRNRDKKFLQQAIRKSETNVRKGGGPFGAVIVQNGEVLSEAGNRVIESNDPTAHAEINVIREASRILGTFDLSGCTIYCSCEPCPMCLAAIYWARIDKIVYANSAEEAREAGFDDLFISEELKKPAGTRKMPAVQYTLSEATRAFELWNDKEGKTVY